MVDVKLYCNTCDDQGRTPHEFCRNRGTPGRYTWTEIKKIRGVPQQIPHDEPCSCGSSDGTVTCHFKGQKWHR